MSIKMRIVKDAMGHSVVVLSKTIFKNKQNIDWDSVEKYLKKYVGKNALIVESKDIVYIGTFFPDEYKDIYSACIVINYSGNGKMYLYDIVDIKREASTPITIR